MAHNMKVFNSKAWTPEKESSGDKFPTVKNIRINCWADSGQWGNIRSDADRVDAALGEEVNYLIP